MEKLPMNNDSYKVHKTIECATRHGSGNYTIIAVDMDNYQYVNFCGSCCKDYIKIQENIRNNTKTKYQNKYYDDRLSL